MSAPVPLSEKLIVDRILRDRWGKNFCLPNYTPPHWWECDVFERTPADYFNEYEVKLTVADFRRDVEKSREVYQKPNEWDKPRVIEKKHELLAAADPRAPSRFFYVTPEGLLNDVTLPEWAGWIEMVASVAGNNRVTYYERLRKKAPRIHSVKMTANHDHHRGTCYFRFHRGRK